MLNVDEVRSMYFSDLTLDEHLQETIPGGARRARNGRLGEGPKG
jgi:hypothetical protein